MAKTLRLSRFGLILWLLTPFVIAAILWTQMDPSRGKPRRLPVTPATSPTGPTTPGESVQSDTPDREPAAAGAHGSAPIPPETLEQGFIIVVTDAAAKASDSSPIYLASNHHGWNPGDPTQKLARRPDGRWQLVLPKPSTDLRMVFKFTRGDWGTVEVGPDFQDVENRELPLIDPSKLETGKPPTIEFVVPAWADQRPTHETADEGTRDVSVAGGRVERLQVVGGGVPISRELIIWLPPGYDDAANASRRYPVLYMQDGQNIFDTHPEAPGEWRMDETCVELIAAGSIEPFIIVGIPHAGQGRAPEYLTTPALEDVEPRGDAYVEFLVSQVLPRVQRVYRVKTGPEHTAIGGSSLGALISLYAGMKHPDVFGKVLAESPSLRIRGREIWREAFDGFSKAPGTVVIGMGGKESRNDEENRLLLESLESFKQWLSSRGAGEGITVTVEPEAGHNEQAWAARLSRSLRTLFPPAP